MIKKIKSSLSVKIFLITAVLLATACVMTYTFIARYMPVSYVSYLDDRLESNTYTLVEELQHTTVEDSRDIIRRFAYDTKTDVIMVGPDDEVVEELSFYYSDAYEINGILMGISVVSSESESEKVTIMTDKEMSASNQSWFTFAGSDDPYYISVNYSMREVNSAVTILKSILPWLILVILVVSLIGALIYSFYVTKPIVRISRISQKMAGMEFNWHCDDRRKDEIGVLAKSLNEMSYKLDKALSDLRAANSALKDDIERERDLERRRLEFFAAVSHELKTPITVMKGQLEGMINNIGTYKDRDKYLLKTLKVSDDLEKMVQEILTISRMESSEFTPDREEFDLSELVREKIEDCKYMIEDKKLSFQESIEKGLLVNADKNLLGKAISNLISNAIHYSPSGEKIDIKLMRLKDKVQFTLLNTGAEIPYESLPRLFEAFYRVDKSRNRQTGGSGLGLYIVKMILEQHNAEYEIKNTEEGVVFTFAILQANLQTT